VSAGEPAFISIEDGGWGFELTLFTGAGLTLWAVLSALVASASQPPHIMAKDVVIQRKKFGIENQRLIKLFPCLFERVKQIPLVDRVPGQKRKTRHRKYSVSFRKM